MKLIGLTGPTGAGKSSLKTVAEKFGYKVIDCDVLARKAVEKETEGLKALVLAFGKDILESDGSLNRGALAEKAFINKESTELLNKTLLPFIADMVMAECKDNDVLLDAPTLFESGLNTKCTATIAVLAESGIRLSRIMARDNISEDAARLRMNAGKTDDFYIKNADYIIYNNCDIQLLKKDFSDILREIKER